MDKIIILGTTNHSKMIRKMIEKENIAEVVAYTKDMKSNQLNDEKEVTVFDGVPLVPFEKIEFFFSTTNYKILNTIGYSDMNRIRQKKNQECLEKGYELYTYK